MSPGRSAQDFHSRAVHSPGMQSVAIIEPDPKRRSALEAALEAAGFRAECFSTATAAVPRLHTGSFALAIIGLDLTDTDPYAVCHEVSRHLPIITLAGECSPETCVRALENGADDCVAHGTSGRELVARIRSVLRRNQTRPASSAPQLSVSLSEMRVRVGRTTHNLTLGETRLLAVLLERAPAPTPITRLTQLLDARRGTVEARIKSLRRKIGPARLVSRGSLGYELLTD